MSKIKMSQRSTEIRTAISAYREEHKRWQDDQNSLAPTSAYWDALDLMLDIVLHGDVPDDCRPIFIAAGSLSEQLEIFDAGEVACPGDPFWRAHEELLSATDREPAPPKRMTLEPIAVLDKQGVTHQQIAKIYGLCDSSGNYDTAAVVRELMNPGSVIGKDWIHPDDIAAEREFEQSQERLQVALARQRRQQQEEEMEKRGCPESIEELAALPGMSADQIIRMKGCTKAEANKALREAEEDRQRIENAKKVGGGLSAPQVEENGPSDAGDDSADLSPWDGITLEMIHDFVASRGGIAIPRSAPLPVAIKRLEAAKVNPSDVRGVGV